MIPSILHRLVIGYSSMLLLMLTVSGYSIIQLGNLKDSARVALRVEQRMIDDSEKLADAFLSEVRYSSKFSVTHSAGHVAQYEQFKADFDRYMAQLKSLATARAAAQHLARADEYHTQYRQLVGKEVDYINTNQAYAETRYREEKERLVDYLLREHEAFKSELQKSLQERIGNIEQAALTSQKFILAATLLLVALGALFAYRLIGEMRREGAGPDVAHGVTLGLRLRFPSWWKGLGVLK